MIAAHSLIFDENNIWLQFHNIPIECIHVDMLQKLGRMIGTIVELDRGEGDSFLGQYVRIRVRLNITRPLKKFIRIKTVGNEEDLIILLVYEKLPDFCYVCGRIGHTFRDCDDESADQSTHDMGHGSEQQITLVGLRRTQVMG